MAQKSPVWALTSTIIAILTFSFMGVAFAQDMQQNLPDQSIVDAKIEAELITQFSSGPADFILRFTEQPDLSPAQQMSWQERGEFVYRTLGEAATRSQSAAKRILDQQGFRYQTFIAGNELYVWAGNLTTAQELAALPEVVSIRATRTYYLQPVKQSQQATWAGELITRTYGPKPSLDAEFDWGILDVHADQFWSTFGSQGEGILVANIDTGVQWDHPALVNQYKCNTNPTDPVCWYDPSNICGGGICDNAGHGTHTMGTMVADNDPSLAYIAGMAPNAKWIACKGCEDFGCSDFALNSCADWILAPGGDSANRPHIVNNSWGGGGGETWYLDKVNAWRAAGIFPAFSAGNNYTCNSLGSPGDYQESFASASHREWDRLISDFSSKGPSVFGDDPYTKPNISAPGENICSTVPGNGWDCYFSGTSMASPHSAGAVALLWSCNPSLIGQIDQTFEILQDTADTPPPGTCGAPADGEGNYTYGHGYLNVLASGQLWCGETGSLQGQVTDATTTLPIGQAHVYSLPGPYQSTTNDAGEYAMTMRVGTYSITAEAFGYYPWTADPVDILTDTVTIQDFALEPAPSAVISGAVTDFTTGWPLYASIDIAGYPNGTIWTDPVTGFYSVTLPQGSSLQFTVNAWVPGYLPLVHTNEPFTGDTTLNFGMFADLGFCSAPGYKMETVYQQDLEANPGGFFTYDYGDGINSWEWGVPTSGPGAAHSGVKVWATNLDGNYNDYEDSYLETPDIDLSTYDGYGVKVAWWDWQETETCCDNVEIQASKDGGASWTTIYGPVWEGKQEWMHHTVSLDGTFTVSNFRLRFHFYSDGSVTYPGWYIDDLTIESNCQPQEGGLVVGNVYDLMYGTALPGAQVINDSGASTSSAYTVDPNLDDSFYVLFSPPGWRDHTASYPDYKPVTTAVEVLAGYTSKQDFYLPSGHLVVDPASLATTLEWGNTQTLELTITNDGNSNASFEIRESDRGWIPVAMEYIFKEAPSIRSDDPQAFNAMPSTPVIMAGADVLLIQDWDAWGYPAITSILNNLAIPYDLIPSSQIPTWDFSPYKMIIIPSGQGGDYYYAFNNNVAKFEEFIDDGGIMLMSVCTFGDSIQLPFGGSNPFNFQDFNYIVDPSHPIFTGVPNPYSGNSASHNSLAGLLAEDRVLVTMGSLPGGDPVMIERQAGNGLLVAGGQTFEWGWGNGQAAGLILENMIAYYYFNWTAFSDLPWLSTNPISGTLTAGGFQAIDVFFDTSQVNQPGDYLAELNLLNDTPYGPLKVPITMTVTPPPDWGKLTGTVNSTGYCDQAPFPIEEAELLIQSSTGITWTVLTDENGTYSWWLDQDGSPYSVTASYPEHQDQVFTGIIISGGATTTLSFDLRWLVPCVKADPLSLETSLILGENITLQLNLTNTGGASTGFEIKEADQGWEPTYPLTVLVPGFHPEETALPRYASKNLVTRNAFEYSLPSSVILMEDNIRVLLVAAADVNQIQAMLQAYPDFESVDVYNARMGTPTLDELLAYDSVVLISNEYFLDSWAMGNVLADYVDAGGTVVQTVPTFYGAGWALSGRFVDEGYSALVGAGDWFLWATLGDYDPSHPIMEGVVSAGDSFRQIMELNADAEWVADWTDDEFVATKGKVVGLNTALFDGYAWTGDIPLIVHNSIVWLMGGGDVPWILEEPITGTLSADNGLAGIDVTFDSAQVTQPGIFQATLNINSDDPVNQRLSVAVTMNVTAPEDWGALTGMVTSLGYCDLNPAPLMNYTVVVDVDGLPLTTTLIEDGSYIAWLPQGTYQVSASADEHLPGSGEVLITAGETSTLDFSLRWMAPCLDVSPTSVSVEVPQGYKFISPFELINTGAGEANFKLKDRTLQSIVVSNGEITVPQVLVAESQQNAPTTTSLNLPPAPSATPLDAGEVLQSWSTSENASPWGIGFDGVDETVWVGEGWGSPYIYEYEQDGTATGRSNQYSWNPYYGPADNAFNWVTGMLWTLDVGGDNCLHEMDPSSGYTGNTLCGPWPISQRGVAYDPAADTWFVGGWNDGMIYHIDSAGNLLDSAYVGLYISGLAYNPQTLHLFVMVNDYDEPVSVLDVANNYSLVGQFYIEGWPGIGNGAGLEIDCDGNLWAVGQVDRTVYQFESGEEASLCEPGIDAPWLTEIPAEGTVPADSTTTIELAFYAFPDMPIGNTYTATLILKSDDPLSDTIRVPIAMTIISPVIDVSINPEQVEKSSSPGTVVNYVLTLRNEGNVADFYSVTIEDQEWPTIMTGSPIYLAPGEESLINLFVFIPATAEDGSFDIMTVRAVSSENPLVSAFSELTTVALYQRLPRLLPSEDSQIGQIGGMVEYHLSLLNASVVEDTFILEIDSAWEAILPFDTVTLSSFESIEFTVQVFIPGEATLGAIGKAILTATSQSDPLASDSSLLTTYAGIAQNYLPAVYK